MILKEQYSLNMSKRVIILFFSRIHRSIIKYCSLSCSNILNKTHKLA